MRKHSFQIELAVLAFMLAGTLFCEAQANQITGAGFTLTVTPGPEYNVSRNFLIFFKIPLYPQIACWIETSDGKFVDTIYVTERGAKNRFMFAPRGGRPEVLPVWYHRKAGQPAIADAVSAATSHTGAAHYAKLSVPLNLGRYIVYLEVNRSYDYNEIYTRANSGVNGQPSIVYRAELDVGRKPSHALFMPVGTGSVDGSDGNIRPGLNGITTALSIIDRVEIVYDGE